MLHPRNEALAYRVWCYASEAEWDLTLRDLAEKTGESFHRVRRVCQRKKWVGRLRVQTTRDDNRIGSFGGGVVRDEQSAIREIGGAAW